MSANPLPDESGVGPPVKRAAKNWRPASVIIRPNGVPWELDMIACRRALVLRQVAGDFDSMEGLAAAVGCSRSTASRFFSGRPTSLRVVLAILGALKLKFENVAKPSALDIAGGQTG
jgi:hypothetical protein